MEELRKLLKGLIIDVDTRDKQIVLRETYTNLTTDERIVMLFNLLRNTQSE